MTSAEPLELLFAALVESFGEKPRRSEPLAAHTTSRLGGPADIWLAVGSVAELVEAVKLARQYKAPLFMLGGGANLLISDSGIRGLVIENRANRVRFPQPGQRGELTTLIVESGVALPSLARRCAKRGLSGLEWAVGVPGTIGGAVVNNAGAYNSDMAASLTRAELLSPDGARLWQPVGWFKYGYRSSRLKHPSTPSSFPNSSLGTSWDTGGSNWIVLQAELQLTFAPVEQVQAQMNHFNETRKRSQPPGATMGSMFKNPPGDYAGRLIEAAGLKGHQIGQARISPVHANFFENLGQASATDMLALIKQVQQTVQTKFGVNLELEIEVIGDLGR